MITISRTNDLAFKKVLASDENKDVLRGFILDFLGIEADEIVIENPYSIGDYKEFLDNEEKSVLRSTYKDISASLKNSNFTAELQIMKTSFFDERSLYYPFDKFCKNYNRYNEMVINSNEILNRYSSLRPVYSLNILGYNHFEEDDNALRIFELYDPVRHKKMNKDLIKIAFFELTKANIETENQGYWRDYFSDIEISNSAPEYIKKAADVIDFANLGKEEQIVAMNLEKAQQTYSSGLNYAYTEGMSKGIAEGMSKGIAEGMSKGIAEGMSKGMAEGMSKGIAEGMSKGMAEGMSKGIAEGMSKGMAEGMSKGSIAGKIETAKEMLIEGDSLEKIARVTKLPLEILKNHLINQH